MVPSIATPPAPAGSSTGQNHAGRLPHGNTPPTNPFGDPVTTRTRPHLPRRPQRRGRLLVLVLTLALVATLGTRALADTGDGESLDSLSMLTSSEDTAQETGSEITPPPAAYAALNPTSDGGDEHVGTDAATPPVPNQDGQDVTVAQDQVQGQAEHPGEQLAADKDQADRDRQPGGPTGCTGDCSTQPPAPDGPPAIAAATGGGLFGWLRGWWSGGSQPEEVQPPPPVPSELAGLDLDEGIDVIKGNISQVEATQAQRPADYRVETPEWQAESGALSRATDGIRYLQAQVEAGAESEQRNAQLADLADLNRRVVDGYERLRLHMVNQQITGSPDINDIESSIHRLEDSLNEKRRARAEGREPHFVSDAATEKFYLDRNRDRISQLQGQAEGGTQDAGGIPHDLDRLPGLERRLQEAQRLWEEQQRPGNENLMSIVEHDAVGQQPTTHGRPVVVPVTPGFPGQTNPPDRNTGYAGNQPKFPNQTVFTTPELDHRPLTRDQEAAAQATSDTWGRINQAGRTATQYLTLGTIGAGIVYTLWLLNGAAVGLAGALLPPELRENPLASPRPTQG
jgi:hypothetical protein